MKVDLRAVPATVWVCLTISFLSVVAAFVYLAATKSDATEFRSFLNTMVNLGTLIVSGGSAVYAGVAAKNSQVARQQTNGGLDKRIALQVAHQLQTHGMENQESEVTTRDGRPAV